MMACYSFVMSEVQLLCSGGGDEDVSRTVHVCVHASIATQLVKGGQEGKKVSLQVCECVIIKLTTSINNL